MAWREKLATALLFLAAALLPVLADTQAVRAGNMTVQIAPWQGWMGQPDDEKVYEVVRGDARVLAEEAGPTRVRVEVTFHREPEGTVPPLTLQVDFVPRWPGYEYDIEVTDADGARIPARRQSGLERQILVRVPARDGVYYVQAAPPDDGVSAPPGEEARTVREPTTGLVATVCRWYDGRRAALSFRFDDSYPSHIRRAIPMLREYGYCGTFYINPGVDEFIAHRVEWEACAARGDQEFANHTMHHQGAGDDAEVDRELGEAATYIRSLFPGRSGLICFNPGGGTVWTHAMPLRQFLDRHNLVCPRPRLAISMTNNRVSAYRDLLKQAIETGAWAMALFHQIEKPWVTEENFRAVLEITREREPDLWIAGMTAVHKYERERACSALSLRREGADAVRLSITCSTDPALYDQPLTVQIGLPDGWTPHTVRIADAQHNAVAIRRAMNGDRPVIRFDLPPKNGEYLIQRR